MGRGVRLETAGRYSVGRGVVEGGADEGVGVEAEGLHEELEDVVVVEVAVGGEAGLAVGPQRAKGLPWSLLAS